MTDNLIHRLEAAEGPSRELDAEIHCAVTGRITHKQLPNGYTMVDQGASYKNERVARSDFIHRNRGPAPSYTASLDAAVSLVPEGWEWQVSNRAIKPHTGRAYLHNGKPRWLGVATSPNPEYRFTENTAATPALALCIAALKAREAGDG